MNQQLKLLREAGQYIKLQQNNVIVINLPYWFFMPAAAQSLQEVLMDIKLLHGLGLKILLLFEAAVPDGSNYLPWSPEQVIDAALFEAFERSISRVRARLEAMLSDHHIGSGEASYAMNAVVSGNLITAKPQGIIHKIDYGLNGKIRKINHRLIASLLTQQAMIIVSPIGHSPSGESFIIDYIEASIHIAAELKAHKLINFTAYFPSGLARELTISEAKAYLATQHMSVIEELNQHRDTCHLLIQHMIEACCHGVRRAYLLPVQLNGSLLFELLTRDGVGLMITEDVYDELRPAVQDDITRLIALIEPFELSGIIVKRSRECLEQELPYFWVMLRDGLMIGCGAIYPYPVEKMAELACFVIHQDYQNSGRATKMLMKLEQAARCQQINQLFALTTQTSHWFVEHGFKKAMVNDLPAKKQAFYNYQRNSQVLIKSIAE